jgi:hypothetical protein
MYRPEDIVGERPCTGCTSLDPLSANDVVWNAAAPTGHELELAATAVPLRVWIEGTRNGTW